MQSKGTGQDSGIDREPASSGAAEGERQPGTAAASKRKDNPSAVLARARRDQLLRIEPWLTSEELARRADVDIDPDSYVQTRRNQRTLLSVLHNGAYLHPCFQFRAHSVDPLPGLEELLSVFPETRTNWAAVFWLFQPTGRLGGRCPAETFAEDPEKVIEAARLDYFGDPSSW